MRRFSWKLLGLLLVMNVLASVITIPCIFYLQMGAFIPKELLLLLVLVKKKLVILFLSVVTLIMSTIGFFFVILLGLFFSRRVGLGLPFLQDWLEGKYVKGSFLPVLKEASLWVLRFLALVACIQLTVVLFVSKELLYGAVFPMPIWCSLSAPLYVALSEETVMRLFFLSFVAWIGFKIKKTSEGKPTNVGMWIAIVLTTLIATAGLILFQESFTPVIMSRVVISFIGGMMYGWFYYQYGLEVSIIFHFLVELIWVLFSFLLFAISITMS